MQLVVDTQGTIRCLYSETIPLAALGQLAIRRGSHVEPTPDGRWLVDLAPAAGPVLGPFALRSAALQTEQRWLEAHWLTALIP